SPEPENSSPPTPLRRGTLAESVSWKLAGSAWMFGHSIPTALMWIGSQSGHLKLEPSAPPTERKTPKPGRVWNEPSPLNWKLRPSPEIVTLPIETVTPTDWKLTIASFGPALVSSWKPDAVSVRNDPSLIDSVSAS